MTRDEFYRFLRRNRKEADEAMKKFEKHNALFHKKIRDILAHL